jgi:hypothetical protein
VSPAFRTWFKSKTTVEFPATGIAAKTRLEELADPALGTM